MSKPPTREQLRQQAAPRRNPLTEELIKELLADFKEARVKGREQAMIIVPHQPK